MSKFWKFGKSEKRNITFLLNYIVLVYNDLAILQCYNVTILQKGNITLLPLQPKGILIYSVISKDVRVQKKEANAVLTSLIVIT